MKNKIIFRYLFLAKCYLIEHRNTMSKKKKNLSNLREALKKVNKIEHKCHYHFLTEAKILTDIGGKDSETEKLFKFLINDCSKMRNTGHRLCEVYWNFARFLKHKKENKEELKYLDECITWDNNLIDSRACKFAINCQDLLMDYSNKKIESQSETHFDSDHEAYEMKSKILSIQRSFHSAIFYIKKAIEYGQENRLKERQKLLIENLCKLLETSFRSKTLEEALKVVEEVQDEKEMMRLRYQVKAIEINHTMKYTNLQPLKDVILKFFDLLKNSNASDEEFYSSFLSVITETRSVLDYSLTDLRIRKYPNAEV